MATIYNSELTRQLTDAAKLQVSREKVPNEIADKVVPTVETNPRLLKRIDIIKRAARTTTGSFTMYTVPTGKRLIITAAYMCLTVDAACDLTSLLLQATFNGETVYLGDIRKQTLTAGNITQMFNYGAPIAVDANSTINFVPTFTVGTGTFIALLYGYLEDTALA